MAVGASMRARAGAVLAAFHEGAGAGIHEGVHEGACGDGGGGDGTNDMLLGKIAHSGRNEFRIRYLGLA